MPARRTWHIGVIVIVLMLVATAVASAQVASLRTPDPEAEPSPSPAAEVDGQDAILGFSGCMREHGIDLPDPTFGMTAFFASGAMDGIDMLSDGFLDAFAACQGYLAAAVPDVDPEQQAEQTERAVQFAECMRAAGIDFPDPDPLGGMSFSSLRDDDGGLVFDPFDPEFQAASRACADSTGARIPGVGGEASP
jgi:hypothetical protein